MNSKCPLYINGQFTEAAQKQNIVNPSTLTVFELVKIIHKAGLPAGVVNIINGTGIKIGEELCADKPLI